MTETTREQRREQYEQRITNLCRAMDHAESRPFFGTITTERRRTRELSEARGRGSN